jgi:hypothetical protein
MWKGNTGVEERYGETVLIKNENSEWLHYILAVKRK